jgi:hypothetical protein
MSVQSCLFALAFVLGGAVGFVIGGLGTTVFLVDRHCGPAFGY